MRNNLQTKELSEYLADQLLALGSDEYLGQCNRVQFMIGVYPHEVSGGDMCKEPLTRYFEKMLNSYLYKEKNNA